MPRARGLFHASLRVKDLERAERFWGELLGIKRHAIPSYAPGTVTFLDLGNTMIHLLCYADDVPMPDPRSTHLCIEVDDVEAGLAEVKERGLEVVRGIFDRPGGARSFYFIDPDGNRVEFIQR